MLLVLLFLYLVLSRSRGGMVGSRAACLHQPAHRLAGRRALLDVTDPDCHISNNRVLFSTWHVTLVCICLSSLRFVLAWTKDIYIVGVMGEQHWWLGTTGRVTGMEDMSGGEILETKIKHQTRSRRLTVATCAHV